MKTLRPLTKPAITRDQLRLYSEASTDHNRIHLDDEIAKKAGLPGVIAHGMLTMAFMGEFLHQALTDFGGKGHIQEMSCRFKAMTFPGDVVTISGVVKKENSDLLECDLEARNQNGVVTATGVGILTLG